MTQLASAEVVSLLEGATHPAPAAALEPEQEEIVVVWRSGPVGAVMSIWRDPDEEPTDDDDDGPFNVDVETYEAVDGVWEFRGCGGSGWPVPYGTRPDLARPALTGFASSIPDESDTLLWTGIAPAGVNQVRIVVNGNEISVPVEPISGAFLVPLPYPPPEPSAFAGV